MRRGREDGDAAAEPLHVNMVRQIEHVWQVVADQDDGQAVITKAKNEVEHLARPLTPIAAMGSSRTMTLLAKAAALATATACR